ncbi:MAG TPA: hypothetical protein VM487_11720 [Phycisphaerae bacterium]|nr:hypothetical protein [Phycisphaerae bacterium]
MADPTAKEVNGAFLNMLDSGMEKQAQDAVNDYIRVRMREDGFARRILPPVQITNDELDRQVDTDKPVKIVDKEPQSPGAISVPFATLPINRYIKGPRFRVMMDRILTPKFTKDIDELRTYDMDIRQILSDNAIKDMLAEEDGKWIAVCNSLLVAQGAAVPETGTIQWRLIAGGITRDTIAESMKIMPSTPNHLNPSTVLVNNVTIWDVVKFGRDEVGGDLSQELFERGFAEREIMGVRWIITIKRDLVPDSSLFQFAEPKFLGKFFILEDTTMYIDRKAFMLEFFAYESLGAAIANVAAVTRADF